jgi:uncharacterized tellurite resistance protein B-like protein
VRGDAEHLVARVKRAVVRGGVHVTEEDVAVVQLDPHLARRTRTLAPGAHLQLPSTRHRAERAAPTRRCPRGGGRAKRMGLFDTVTQRPITLTTRLALAAGLTYIIAADGVIDPNERAALFRVVPDEDLIEVARTYVKRTRFADFLARARALLNPGQARCLLLNMIDTALSDGYLAPEEHALLAEAARAFGVSDEQLAADTQTLRAKNNLSQFT